MTWAKDNAIFMHCLEGVGGSARQLIGPRLQSIETR